MRGTTEGDWLSQFLVPRSKTNLSRSVVPLGASLLLHGLLAVPLVLISFLPRAEAKPPHDAWAGDTFEVAMAGQSPAPVAEVGGGGTPAVSPEPSETTPETPADGPQQEPAPLAPPTATAPPEADDSAERAKRAEQAKRAARAKARAERRAREAQRRRERSKSTRKNRNRRPESRPSAGEREGDRTAEQAGEREGAGSDPSGSGSLGAAGLPTGVRELPLAFTRVLPRAAVGDLRFSKRGTGDLGEIRFTLHLDSAGKIERAEYAGTPDALLKSLIERTLRFLGKGQFALKDSPGENLGGTQDVTVQLELKQTTPTPDTDDPSATRSLGFEPPRRSGKRVGFGYFELESGLRFEAKVSFD